MTNHPFGLFALMRQFLLSVALICSLTALIMLTLVLLPFARSRRGERILHGSWRRFTELSVDGLEWATPQER